MSRNVLGGMRGLQSRLNIVLETQRDAQYDNAVIKSVADKETRKIYQREFLNTFPPTSSNPHFES